MLAFIIPNLGLPEIMMIMLLALLLFGPKKIPEIGRTLGRGLREFKRSTSGFMDSINSDLDAMDQPQPKAKAALPNPQSQSQTESPAKKPQVREMPDEIQEAEVVIDLESEEKPS